MRVASLETPRLLMRPWSIEDLEALHQLWTDARVRRYLWDDEVISRERALSVLKEYIASAESDGVAMWSIVTLQAQEQLIGFCGFRYFYQPDQSRQVELLYGLAPTDWGQGLATEAARAVLNYAFRTQLFRRVYARTDEPNHASVGVLRRLGMKFEAKLSLDGRPTLSYCLSADDFPLQPERLRIVAHD